MATKSNTTESEVPVAKLEHDATKWEDFAEQHGKKILYIVLGAVVLIIGYFIMNYRKEAGITEAAAELTRAETVEQLQKVVDNFPGDNASGSAMLLIADKLQEEDKAEEAFAVLEKFVNTKEGHPLYYKGKSDLALKKQAKGEIDEAISLLTDASTPGNGSAFEQQIALLRLGDAYVAKGLAAQKENDTEAAKAAFDEAQVAYEKLETDTQAATLKRTATQRKERVPHLSIPALTEAEAKAKAAEATPGDPAPDAETIEIPPPGDGEAAAPADNEEDTTAPPDNDAEETAGEAPGENGEG